MKFKFYMFIFVNLVFLFIVLSNGCYINKGLNKEQVEKLINENLKPGDTESKIISFLDSQKCLYEFDSFQKRYQILCPNCEKKRYILSTRDIYIYIYVDTEKSNSFKYAEVLNIYSSL